MATYTDNYHLEKPAQSDLYNIDVFNGNADIIDAALASKALAQNQATIESTNSASRNYAKGEFLVYNGLLYKVTAAISSGGTIAPGTNCVATNTGTELKALNDSLSTKSTIATVDIFTSNDHVVQVNSASGNVVSLSNFISAFVIDTNNLVAVPYTYSNLVYLVVKNNSNMQNASDGNYKIRVRYYT